MLLSYDLIFMNCCWQTRTKFTKPSFLIFVYKFIKIIFMLTNKIALITGGSRGLGKYMALRLAEKGHDVIITYNSNKEAADGVVAEIEAKGAQAAALPLDVADFKSLPVFLQQFTAILKSKWGKDTFDFLVNNAGIGATIPF